MAIVERVVGLGGYWFVFIYFSIPILMAHANCGREICFVKPSFDIIIYLRGDLFI